MKNEEWNCENFWQSPKSAKKEKANFIYEIIYFNLVSIIQFLNDLNQQ